LVVISTLLAIGLRCVYEMLTEAVPEMVLWPSLICRARGQRAGRARPRGRQGGRTVNVAVSTPYVFVPHVYDSWPAAESANLPSAVVAALVSANVTA
jgi:hypothetical protein